MIHAMEVCHFHYSLLPRLRASIADALFLAEEKDELREALIKSHMAAHCFCGMVCKARDAANG